MSLTYTLKENVIKVNGGTGIKVRDQKNLNYQDYDWDEGFIQMYDIGNSKKYKIYMTFEFDIDLTIIRPRGKYEDKSFEDLFGFKFHCSDYDETKIISIW